MNDHFNGDTPHLIRCIEALLKLDADGALVPHGIPGHARTMLEAAAVRLLAEPVAEVVAGTENFGAVQFSGPIPPKGTKLYVHGVMAVEAPKREAPPGKWKVDMPDGTYGRMPGDPPGPASVRAVIGGYVYDVEPQTGRLRASEVPRGVGVGGGGQGKEGQDAG